MSQDSWNNWKLWQGRDFHQFVEQATIDEAGVETLLDLTGYDAELHFRAGTGGTAIKDVLTTAEDGGLVITPATGRIDIYITAAQSADTTPTRKPWSVEQGLPIGALPFNLDLIHPDGTREMILDGTIQLIRGVNIA